MEAGNVLVLSVVICEIRGSFHWGSLAGVIAWANQADKTSDQQRLVVGSSAALLYS
jgi:hypothetical protein